MDGIQGLGGLNMEASAATNGPTAVAEAFDAAVQSVVNKDGALSKSAEIAEEDSVVDRTLKTDTSKPDETAVDGSIEQLKEVMDYATEMHLFVRSSTQLGSAMNTLIKGQ